MGEEEDAYYAAHGGAHRGSHPPSRGTPALGASAPAGSGKVAAGGAKGGKRGKKGRRGGRGSATEIGKAMMEVMSRAAANSGSTTSAATTDGTSAVKGDTSAAAPDSTSSHGSSKAAAKRAKKKAAKKASKQRQQAERAATAAAAAAVASGGAGRAGAGGWSLPCKSPTHTLLPSSLPGAPADPTAGAGAAVTPTGGPVGVTTGALFTCRYQGTPFDSNGVLYCIATAEGSRPYRNPHSSGEVVAAMSSCSNGSPERWGGVGRAGKGARLGGAERPTLRL